MNLDVKICGVRTREAVKVSHEAGARFVGLVFYPSSSRFLQIEQAIELAQSIPSDLQIVGLFVNPSDHMLQQIVDAIPLDFIQLHGDETPERVEEIRIRYELPVIKAIPVAAKEDIDLARKYENTADWLLFDTKAPTGEYGGTGQSFDWGLLRGLTFKRPWMLSGGLNTENVQKALQILKPDAVDVSSGVESSRGIKDSSKIKAFIEAVKAV